MPNYISYADDWYKLSDDPVKAKASVTSILAGNPSQTSTQILSNITSQDSSVSNRTDNKKRKKETGS